jgi:hypothetical protein
MLMALLLSPMASPQTYDYQGFFNGPVDTRGCPNPGYYYDPQTPVPRWLRHDLEPVRVKVYDGGPSQTTTRYKTYLYSEDPLPGQYWYQDPGRMRPILTDGPGARDRRGQVRSYGQYDRGW